MHSAHFTLLYCSDHLLLVITVWLWECSRCRLSGRSTARSSVRCNNRGLQQCGQCSCTEPVNKL